MKSTRSHITFLFSCSLPVKALTLCFLLLPLFSFATVRYVPSQYSTIQAAIDAAVNGDEIIVYPDYYWENINFLGKNIILRSTDPTNPDIVAITIIDGNQAGSVVTFSGAELPTCVLSGFTIKNGSATYGAGIYGNGTLATIEKNIIADNSTTPEIVGYGGGLCRCHGTIQGNTILGNSASEGGGLWDCDGTIQNNTISNNSASVFGAGLCRCDGTIQNNAISNNFITWEYGVGGGLYYCHGTIQNNTISGNSGIAGGGLFDCDGTIQNNIISNNSASSFGGGLYQCDGTIQGNIISGNSAMGTYGHGGGLAFCNGSIQNNIINSNSASYGGGLSNCAFKIRHNTIYGNSALGEGGGLIRCNADIRNCIIWANTAPVGAQLFESTTPFFSCIQGWTSNGPGNITLNPQLANPAQGDFHLQPSSPCIDAGSYIYNITQDFEGDPRPYDGSPEPRGDGSDYDIGADEYYIAPTPTPTSTPTPSPTPTPTAIPTFTPTPTPSPTPSPTPTATPIPSPTPSATPTGTPTPTPTPTPSPSPTPSPTPTPTPTPPAMPIVFDFLSSTEGWTIGTAPGFSAPDFLFTQDYLKIVSSTNTNTFGYWQSPQQSVPADANYLYRARFKVSTNVTNQWLVPQVRLRANSWNLQQYDVLSIESAGSGNASPEPFATHYDFYFVPPANDTAVMLAFDLLNFNPEDAAEAELALDTVTIDRFALDSLSPGTAVRVYTFDLTTQGWNTGGAPIFFSVPDYNHTAGALELRSTTNTNTFGYWANDPADITIEADRLYRGTFEVRTDVTNRPIVPEMRLRFNAVNLQASHTFGIASAGDGANSPGTTNTTYDRLYFLPPPNCVGEGLIISFDILNFDSSDAATGALMLNSVLVESLDVP